MSDADNLDPVLFTAMAQLLHLRTRLGASRELLQGVPAIGPSDLCFLRSAPGAAVPSEASDYEIVAVPCAPEPHASVGIAGVN
jgi:hypothetical protein